MTIIWPDFKMFPKPLNSQALSKRANLKNSLLNNLKDSAIRQMPKIATIMNNIFPKKTLVIVYHLEDHVSLYAVDNTPVLVETGNHIIFPTLPLAMHYPGLLPVIYVDEGAVKALLRGAKLMSPGIKKIDQPFQQNDVVEIRLLETNVPFAIGIAEISSEECAQKPKGVGIIIGTIIRDGLYMAALSGISV